METACCFRGERVNRWFCLCTFGPGDGQVLDGGQVLIDCYLCLSDNELLSGLLLRLLVSWVSDRPFRVLGVFLLDNLPAVVAIHTQQSFVQCVPNGFNCFRTPTYPKCSICHSFGRFPNESKNLCQNNKQTLMVY